MTLSFKELLHYTLWNIVSIWIWGIGAVALILMMQSSRKT